VQPGWMGRFTGLIGGGTLTKIRHVGQAGKFGGAVVWSHHVHPGRHRVRAIAARIGVLVVIAAGAAGRERHKLEAEVGVDHLAHHAKLGRANNPGPIDRDRNPRPALA